MTTRPRLTVLVPAFQDEPHLDAALESVLAQGFAEIEVVVRDDASTDRTAEVALGWCRRDARVRLLRNESNAGMTENWNLALAEARASLVFKLDADDVLEPGTLVPMAEALEREPEARFAACRTVECDESLEARAPFHGERAFRAAGLDPARDRIQPGWRWFERSFDDAQLWHSSAQLHRTEELRALGGWDPTWSCASDTDLLLRLLATDRPVVHLGHVGVRYRRRVGSVSERSEREGWKRIESVLTCLQALERTGTSRVLASARLRRNWWRLWSNARVLAGDPRLWDALPEGVRAKLEPVAAALRRPPAPVRVEGWLRDRLWALRQRRGTVPRSAA